MHAKWELTHGKYLDVKLGHRCKGHPFSVIAKTSPMVRLQL